MRWWRDGKTVGVGTVVATFRSAPRPPGASMLVGPAGEAVGSVSGGCVEGAVYDLGQSVVTSGQPVLQRYGVSDDDAFAVGLTCGGILDVYVESVDRESFPELSDVVQSVKDGRPVAIAKVIKHPDPDWLGGSWWLGRTRWSASWVRHAPTMPSPTTPAGCWPPVAARHSSTARTASAAARACRCS